ncbi:MAG: FHA domain-containing protein, partial [Planctomycetota bacterium]
VRKQWAADGTYRVIGKDCVEFVRAVAATVPGLVVPPRARATVMPVAYIEQLIRINTFTPTAMADDTQPAGSARWIAGLDTDRVLKTVHLQHAGSRYEVCLMLRLSERLSFYRIRDATGTVVRVGDALARELAWCSEAAGLGELSAANRDELGRLRRAYENVRDLGEVISWASKAQQWLIKGGVIGVKAWATSGASLAHDLGATAMGEIEELLIASPEVLAKALAVSLIDEACARLHRLELAVEQVRDSGMGADARHAWDSARLRALSADAYWVRIMLDPAAALMIALQPDASWPAQIARMGETAARTAIGTAAPSGDVAVAKALLRAGDIAGALATTVGEVGAFRARVQQASQELAQRSLGLPWDAETSGLWRTAIFQAPESKPEPPPDRPLSLALCLDTSGSMQQDNRIADARRAASTLVGLLDKGDRAALIPFAGQARVAISLQADTQALRAAIMALQPKGSTDFEQPLRLAYNEVLRAADPRGVLLLSDGKARYPQLAVGALRSEGTPVYTIAFGADADTGVLQRIARETGGVFFPAGKENIQQVFQRIGGRARGLADLLVERGVILPNATCHHPVVVPPGSQALQASVAWPGSDIGLELIAPDGQRHRWDAPAPAGVRFSHDQGNHVRTIHVEQPSPGTWQLIAHGVDIPTGGEPYTITAAARAEPGQAVAALVPQAARFGIGGLLPLEVQVPAALRTTGLQAEVRAPDGTLVRLPLRDDGRGGDRLDSDGVYSAQYRAPEVGFYDVGFRLGDDRWLRATYQVGETQQIVAQGAWYRRRAAEDPLSGLGVVAMLGGGGGGGGGGGSTASAAGRSIIWVVLLFAGALVVTVVVVYLRRPAVSAPRQVWIIGRDPACDIVVDDSSVSARHCRLTWEDGILTATDLDSSNGTWVDGQSIRCAIVPDGVALQVGDVPLDFGGDTQSG